MPIYRLSFIVDESGDKDAWRAANEKAHAIATIVSQAAKNEGDYLIFDFDFNADTADEAFDIGSEIHGAAAEAAGDTVAGGFVVSGHLNLGTDRNGGKA